MDGSRTMARTTEWWGRVKVRCEIPRSQCQDTLGLGEVLVILWGSSTSEVTVDNCSDLAIW